MNEPEKINPVQAMIDIEVHNVLATHGRQALVYMIEKMNATMRAKYNNALARLDARMGSPMAGIKDTVIQDAEEIIRG